MIEGARQQAQTMIQGARNAPPFPPEVLQNLDRTIQTFQRANLQLHQELSQLNEYLRAKLPTNDNGHHAVASVPEATPQAERP